MLFKVNKRLVPSQMIEHIDRHSIINEKISGYRKGHYFDNNGITALQR